MVGFLITIEVGIQHVAFQSVDIKTVKHLNYLLRFSAKSKNTAKVRQLVIKSRQLLFHWPSRRSEKLDFSLRPVFPVSGFAKDQFNEYQKEKGNNVTLVSVSRAHVVPCDIISYYTTQYRIVCLTRLVNFRSVVHVSLKLY